MLPSACRVTVQAASRAPEPLDGWLAGSARRDAEHLRGAVGVQVKEHSQRDDLPLPGRQPHQRGHDRGIDYTAADPVSARQVREPARIGDRHFPAAAPPPGNVLIQRGADHPRRRRRMPADLPPRCARPGESLINKLLRRVRVTDAHQNRAEALIPGSAVELREVQPLGSHA